MRRSGTTDPFVCPPGATCLPNGAGGGGGIGVGEGSGGGGGGGGGCGAPSLVRYGACILGNGAMLPVPVGGRAPLQNVNCCLAAGVPMQLWNGGCRDSGEIKPGDVLIGRDKDGSNAPQTVLQVTEVEQPCLEITFNGGSFVCSRSHQILTGDSEWARADSIEVGTPLVSLSGLVQVVQAVEDAGVATVFAVECGPDHTFFAAGVLHHNASEKNRKQDSDPGSGI